MENNNIGGFSLFVVRFCNRGREQKIEIKVKKMHISNAQFCFFPPQGQSFSGITFQFTLEARTALCKFHTRFFFSIFFTFTVAIKLFT